MKLEVYGFIPLLDVKAQKTDTKLSFSIYRKPLQKDKHLQFSSNHYISTEQSVVNILVHRTLTQCDRDKLSGDIEQISKVLHKTAIISSSAGDSSFWKRTEWVETYETQYIGLLLLGHPFIKFLSKDYIC